MNKNLASIRAGIGFPQEDNNGSERFILAGGLNIEEPSPTGDAGKLFFCQNFEPNYLGGYRSKPGYERVDGQRQPSAWYYIAVKIGSIIGLATAKPAIGAAVTGNTSGANGFFLGWETIGGVTHIILAKVLPTLITADFKLSTDPAWTDTLNFVAGETIHGPLGNFAILGTGVILNSLPDNARAGYYIEQARLLQIAKIQPVGGAAGSGRALGVFDLNGVLYGIRNNSGATASTLWKASQAGWVSVPLGLIVYFRTLTAEVAEGDVITNPAATISMTVRRVVIMFGTPGSGDAIGYFVTDAVTGGPFIAATNLLRGGTVIAATPASGVVQLANTLPPNTATKTNYRFRRWNFSGAPSSSRIYGVNGKGPAFEFDGTVFTPIITGIGISVATWNTISALEKPTVIAAHADHLFLGYRGGALQHSGFQTPTVWTAVQGADTRQTGDDITNMVEDINGTMLIQTRGRNGILYGDVNENFQLRWVASSFGGYPDTACRLNGATFLTDEGVMFQGQSQDFGNFQSLSQSQQVNSLLRNLMRQGVGASEATVSRERSMYRLYFGARCLSFCIVGNELRGIGYCDYINPMTNFWSGESTISTGNSYPAPERIFMCGAFGHIYQDDIGGSFDSNYILGKFQTQFYYGQENTGLTKRYRRLRIDLLGADAYTGLKFSAEYDDGAGYRTTEAPEDVTHFLTGGAYNAYSMYDQAFYGPAGKNIIRKELHNQACAISVICSFQSKIALPFTVQAIEVDYATRNRRGLR